MIIDNKLDNIFFVSADRQTFLGFEMTANLRDTSPLSFHVAMHEKRFGYIGRSDEGLTVQTSALKSLYGGQATSSTPLIKPIIKFSASDIAFPRVLIGSLNLGYQLIYRSLTLYGKRKPQVSLS